MLNWKNFLKRLKYIFTRFPKNYDPTLIENNSCYRLYRNTVIRFNYFLSYRYCKKIQVGIKIIQYYSNMEYSKNSTINETIERKYFIDHSLILINSN